MTLVKDISPTGIKAMRERISAEVSLARELNRRGVNKQQWAIEARRARKDVLAHKWQVEAFSLFDKRHDHMDAARRCKWELTQLEEAERH